MQFVDFEQISEKPLLNKRCSEKLLKLRLQLSESVGVFCLY